jgi:hypothetical protein
VRYWIELQAETLYVSDGAGRIVGFNEATGMVARCPIVFVGRSAGGNVVRLHRDVPPELAEEIERLLADEPAHVEEGAPRCADALCARVYRSRLAVQQRQGRRRRRRERVPVRRAGLRARERARLQQPAQARRCDGEPVMAGQVPAAARPAADSP